MRWLLVLLCCLAKAGAQVPLFEKDSAAVERVSGLPGEEPFDTAHPYNRAGENYIYILSSNDVYHLFGYSTYTEFSRFDFSRYHITGIQVCMQCRRVCRHEEGLTTCHRNRCQQEWIWLKRENEKAFTGIPSLFKEGHADVALPDGRQYFLRDTVIPKTPGSAMMAWYINAGGDCHARYEFDVLSDRYYPVVLLKEWNYYGGCRAGGFRDFTVTFTAPENKHYFIRRTVLMD